MKSIEVFSRAELQSKKKKCKKKRCVVTGEQQTKRRLREGGGIIAKKERRPRKASEQWQKISQAYTRSAWIVSVCLYWDAVRVPIFLFNNFFTFFFYFSTFYTLTYTTYPCRTLFPTQRHTQTSSMNKPKFSFRLHRAFFIHVSFGLQNLM